MKWYLLHPAVVHFPIALLSVGVAAYVASLARGEEDWTAQAASWLLWLGALAAWAAFGLGHLAEDTAPHVPAAWKVLAEHKELAGWTVGLFSALAAWRAAAVLRGARPGRGHKAAFLAAWLACLGVLYATAFLGGKVVFDHGMGVVETGFGE